MKFAVCYKGVFNIGKIKSESENKDFLESFKEATKNHTKNLFDALEHEGHIFDIFMSTYKISSSFDELVLNSHNFKNCIFSDLDESKNTWQSQLYHHKVLMEILQKNKPVGDYDFIIITRPDIKFHKKISDVSLDKSKFNIVMLHPSGNCDDNFWFFPSEYMEIFKKSIYNLKIESKTTHEINKEIIKNGGQIFYMERTINTQMGHTFFSFVR